MLTYKNKTFCSSPNCENKSGRKMTSEQVFQALDSGLLVSYHPFCKDNSITYEQVSDALDFFHTHGVKDGKIL